jgi:cell division septation protein DedD
VVMVDGETLKPKSRVTGGARDIWFPILWDGFRPRAASLDEPVRFDSVPVADSTADTTAIADSSQPQPAPPQPAPEEPQGFVVSFASYLSEARAKDLAARVRVGGEQARVITSPRDASTIYRVVLGPFATREEAERVGKESGLSYWIFEGYP